MDGNAIRVKSMKKSLFKIIFIPLFVVFVMVFNMQFTKANEYSYTCELNGEEFTRADLNRDGKVDSKDVKFISLYNSYLFDLRQVFPAIYGYAGSINSKYSLNDVYAKKISGKICDTVTDPSCTNIGKGLISNFNDVKGGNLLKINSKDYVKKSFKVNFTDYGKSELGISDIENDNCVFSIQSEIITYNDSTKGNLELGFRTIDTNTPFLRNTKTNWCNITNDETNWSSDNNTVITYIKNRNNSYNITQTGSLYTNQISGINRIVLTPQLIKQIREYNEIHPYDDYELECKPSGCVNAFLDEYGIVKVSS